MSTGTEPVGIVGGGLGGLAAACTLAARGHKVVLFEQNDWLGGKAAVLSSNGYRFDMGPTIGTLRAVVARVFAEAGEDMGAALEPAMLDPQWRCFFDDGSRLDLVADGPAMSQALDRFAPGAHLGAGYAHFLARSAELRELAERYFFWRPVGGLRAAVAAASPSAAQLARDLWRTRPWQTVAGMVRRHLKDARVAQMADHFTQYVGSSPMESPAVLCSIAHMQTSDGVWYPKGGIGALPAALGRLARQLGAELRTGTRVTRILTEGNSVTGIETQGSEALPVAAVVCNADVVCAHRELVGGQALARFERRWKREPACSGVVLYLGLRHRYDHLLHHNFVFSRDPEEEFSAIYQRCIPAPDPTCYVCAPARTDPSVAPDGGEALYVLVHTPYLRPGQDWQALFHRYRQTIIGKLRRTAGLGDIEDRIAFEGALTPQDIHKRYSTLRGAIYGLASHGRLKGAFKPGNRSRDVKGLYFAGGSVHPGPGMPMAIMSGWIAADALHQDGL